MKASLWALEPHRTVVLRDGRPFASAPGAKAYSVPFPFPSTLAGAARTHLGSDPQSGGFSGEALGYAEEEVFAQELLTQIGLRGPFLVRLGEESGQIEDWYLPAPLDAVCFDGEDAKDLMVYALRPRPIESDEATDLSVSLQPFFLEEGVKGKPAKNAPRFWSWSALLDWLHNPSSRKVIASELGLGGLSHEWRTHVSVREDSATAEDGALFQVQGLSFLFQNSPRQESSKLQGTSRLALAAWLQTEERWDARLREGFGYLGGERRVAYWRQQQALDALAMPSDLEEKIVQAKGVRVLLATPAPFTKGTYPTWLLEPRHGVTVTLQAIRTERPQVISGWDLQKKTHNAKRKGAPKPTRRLMVAGSVFSLKLDGSEDAIREWLRSHWLQPIADEEQDRRDGFGIALLGTP
jgi:CRISPR-associated protein Cmr3